MRNRISAFVASENMLESSKNNRKNIYRHFKENFPYKVVRMCYTIWCRYFGLSLTFFKTHFLPQGYCMSNDNDFGCWSDGWLDGWLVGWTDVWLLLPEQRFWRPHNNDHGDGDAGGSNCKDFELKLILINVAAVHSLALNYLKTSNQI